MSGQRPKKLLRSSRACDFCHKRSIRCKASSSPGSCENCIDFGISCTYDRPVKRGRRRDPPTDTGTNAANGTDISGNHSVSNSSDELKTSEKAVESPSKAVTTPPDAAWKAFASVTHSLIVYLIDIYFQVVYPIFPFFDRQHLLDQINNQLYHEDREFFAAIMSACAIAAGRVADGNLRSTTDNVSDSTIKPRIFFAAAEESLPHDITKIISLDALKVYPLLAIAAIQRQKIEVMHKYIGQYFAILSIRRWHDEANWPKDWSDTERDEMRRVYWSTYTLDVYSSIVWNGCVHYQEAHSQVNYPSEAPTGEYHLLDPFTPSWMVGWNFTTDLYRVLEHAVSRFRTQSSRFNILDVATPSSSTFSSGLNSRVNALFLELPDNFKTIKDMSGVPAQDIYGFQAANIQATSALLRMMLFSVEEGNDVGKKCSVASELLDVFHRIPKPYLTAIGAPLVYHLSGIGHILGSVINIPLTETSYSMVRQLLISMADLLASLESVLHKSAGAGKSLLEQVGRIDEFMASERHNNNTRAAQTIEGNLNGWANALGQEVSPRYQLPDDILLDWNWPLDITAENPFLLLQ